MFLSVICPKTSSSQCHEMTYPRQRVVEELQKYITIDCLGACLNNGPRLTESGVKAASRYKFYLGLEKMIDGDYCTETHFHAYLGNSLGVYIGSSRAAAFSPFGNASYVDGLAFKNVHDLGRHLVNLSNNYTLYASYFAWRQRPPSKALVALEQFSHDNEPLCRLCSFLQTNLNTTYNAGIGSLPNVYRFDES